MSALPRQILTRFRCFPEQTRVLANDRGIDVVIAGVGGGKTWVAGLKNLFLGLRHPRRRNGDPTEWLVLGRDYPVVHDMQLAEIVKHTRQLCHPGELQELEVKGGEGPASAMSWAFEGEHGLTLREPEPRSLAAAWVEKWVTGDRYLVRPLISIPERAVIARAVGGTRPCVELTTGVKFWGFSATDTSRMRAFAFDGGWLDEAEYQTIQSFEMASNRQRSGKGGLRLTITSSPAAAGQGWLWAVISGKYPRWDPIRTANPLRVHRWASEDNPTNDPGQLAAIRAVLDATSPGKSAGELDGLFVGTEEAPGMGPVDYARAFVGRVSLSIEDLRPAAIGVDIGETVDFTWLTVLSATGVVLAMDRFNKGSPKAPRDGFYPFLEDEVEALALKWRVPKVVVDIAKAGVGVQEHLEARLRGRGVVVEPYRTDAPGRKSELLESLGTALSRGDVRIPTAWTAPGGEERHVEWVDFLRKEFGDLIAVDIAPGKRRFVHPDGSHDDGIVSLGLAYHAIAGRSPQRTNYSGWNPQKYGGGGGGASGPRFGGGLGRFGGGGGRFSGS